MTRAARAARRAPAAVAAVLAIVLAGPALADGEPTQSDEVVTQAMAAEQLEAAESAALKAQTPDAAPSSERDEEAIEAQSDALRDLERARQHYAAGRWELAYRKALASQRGMRPPNESD